MHLLRIRRSLSANPRHIAPILAGVAAQTQGGSAMADIMKSELSKLSAAAAPIPDEPPKQSSSSLANAAGNPKRFNFSEADVSVSEKDMEEYRKGKTLASDPMAGYLDQNEGALSKKQRKAH